jgi:hypothetical protein
MTRIPDYLSEGFQSLCIVTSYISRTPLPDGFLFAASMWTPTFWTPVKDFVLPCRFVDLGYDQAEVLFDKSPDDFKEIRAAGLPSPAWLDARKRLIIYEVIQFIHPHYPNRFGPVRDVSRFTEIQKGLMHRNFLTRNDQRHILNVLYLYGIPAVPNRWAVLRKMCRQTECISPETYAAFVSGVQTRLSSGPDADWSDLWVSSAARYQLAEQLTFFDLVRQGFVRRDLSRIKAVPWPEGPKAWNVQCDATLVRVIVHFEFISTIRLICEVVVHFPFAIQRQIGGLVRFLRGNMPAEPLTMKPFNFFLAPANKAIGDITIFGNIPVLRRRVLTMLFEQCPERPLDLRADMEQLLVESIQAPDRPRLDPPAKLSMPTNPFIEYFQTHSQPNDSPDNFSFVFPSISTNLTFPIAMNEAELPCSELQQLEPYRVDPPTWALRAQCYSSRPTPPSFARPWIMAGPPPPIAALFVRPPPPPSIPVRALSDPAAKTKSRSAAKPTKPPSPSRVLSARASPAKPRTDGEKIAELEGRVGNFAAQYQVDMRGVQAQLTLLTVQVADLINKVHKGPVMVDTQTSPIEPPPTENSRAAKGGRWANLANVKVDF